MSASKTFFLPPVFFCSVMDWLDATKKQKTKYKIKKGSVFFCYTRSTKAPPNLASRIAEWFRQIARKRTHACCAGRSSSKVLRLQVHCATEIKAAAGLVSRESGETREK